ncbi:hypothetical protein [Peribacillus sp. SCS-155]|uniref:hypothetical protein n=1 Tax=Peribacillus sedimenti TaxID=3115297 RepID=UPI003905EC92
MMRYTNQTEYGNLDKRNDLTGPGERNRRGYPKIPHDVSIEQKNSSQNKSK